MELTEHEKLELADVAKKLEAAVAAGKIGYFDLAELHDTLARPLWRNNSKYRCPKHEVGRARCGCRK